MIKSLIFKLPIGDLLEWSFELLFSLPARTSRAMEAISWA